ncbi:hypothetical protein [Planctomicrobium sp. SH664]|uniref:hypothetical protein n=1 Tax=Planctomicrobium sp. SH664 TaxID=3448125 RepID=UPI003F5CA3A9
MPEAFVLAEFSQETLHGVSLDVAQRFEFTAVDHTANPAHRQLDVLGRVLATGETFLKLLEVIFDAGSFPLCKFFLLRVDHPHSAKLGIHLQLRRKLLGFRLVGESLDGPPPAVVVEVVDVPRGVLLFLVTPLLVDL